MRLTTQKEFTVRLIDSDTDEPTVKHYLLRSEMSQFWFAFQRLMVARNGDGSDDMNTAVGYLGWFEANAQYLFQWWERMITRVEGYQDEDGGDIMQSPEWRRIVIENCPSHIQAALQGVMGELSEQARLPFQKPKSGRKSKAEKKEAQTVEKG